MQFAQLKRREFIALLGGVAVVWPLAARAQQMRRIRRIGVLMPFAENDSDYASELVSARSKYASAFAASGYESLRPF